MCFSLSKTLTFSTFLLTGSLPDLPEADLNLPEAEIEYAQYYRQ